MSISNPVNSTKDKLPILELSWQNFERLSRDLLESEYPSLLNPRLYLSQGYRQYGIDVQGFDPKDGKSVYLQCKQVNNFSDKDVLKAVKLFEDGKFIDSAKTFILCVRAKINEKYEDTLSEIENRLNKSGIAFEIWDEKKLNILLKKYPQIVFDLFDVGNVPNWVKTFNGELAANNLIYRPKKKEYKSPEYYQPRVLSWIDKEAKQSIQTTLPEIFTSNFDKIPNLILLKSEATIGKTTELKYIAHHYSVIEKELFFPILISLKNYVNESIQELISRYENDWKHISEKEFLLLLDGLDEVKTDERENFIRKLGQFIEANPDVNIILSSRTNFITESTQLKDFEIFYLREFDEKAIESYTHKLLPPESIEGFLELIKENNIKHWLKSPFCLYHFIGFYKTDASSIPQTRVELIERILELKLNRDFERSFIEEIAKESYRKSLQKLAFAMNLLGRNSLELTELNEIFTNEEFEKIRKMSVIEINDKSIYFEHNILQEFLSALILSKQNFEKIVEFIAFLPDFEKIKPKWFNTIGILLEILPINSPLINKIILLISEKEPSILGNIEYKFFPLELRFEAFKKIILDPNRAYRRDNLYEDKLTRFAGLNENSDVLDFLLELIKTKDGFLRDEAIYSLRHKEAPFWVYEGEIIDTCLEVFKKVDENTIVFLVETLNTLEITDERMVDFLADLFAKTQNFKLIDDILGYLNMSNKTEDYFHLYLDSIQKFKEFRKKEATHYMGLGFSLSQGLKQAKSSTNLYLLLDFLIENVVYKHESIFHKDFYSEDNFFISFSKNLSLAYQKDSFIYEKVLALYLNSEHYHDEVSKNLIPFFIETETTERAFWDILKYKDANEEKLWGIHLGKFINEKILDECFDKYQKKELYNKQMWFILNNSWINNDDITASLRLKLNAVSNNSFAIKEHLNWEKIRSDKKQKDFELLIDKTQFVEKTLHFFEYYEKNELTQEEVFNYRKDWEEGDNEVVGWFLNSWFHGNTSEKKEQKIKKEEVIKWLTTEKLWEDYVIGEFYRLLNDKTDFPKNCIDYIQQWCDENLEKLNFSTAMEEKVENSWSTRWLELRYANFFLKLDISVPENVLLEMLSFDTFHTTQKDAFGKSYSLTEKIISLVGTEKAKVKFLQNVQMSTLPLLSLDNQIGWCKKLTIIESIPYIKAIIEQNHHKNAYRLNSIFDAFIALKGNLIELSFIFTSFDIDNEFHWYLLDEMVKIIAMKKRIGKLLISKIEPNIIDENLFKASFILIEAGFIEGLEWYATWYKSTPTITDRNKYIKDVSHLPEDKALNILFELLKYLLVKKIGDWRFTDPIGILFGLLKPIALKSEESFKSICNFLNQKSDLEIDKSNVYTFRSNLLTFVKDYYLQKSDYQHITEIKEHLSEI